MPAETDLSTRPIMGRAELTAAHIDAHGRDHTVSDDGYDDMAQAERAGWHVLSAWGRDGWDLGAWPYVTIQTSERDGRWLVQQIVEGDRDVYSFTTEADRDAALDYLFLWYAAGKPWAPLDEGQRTDLDKGGCVVDPKWRGPYRPS